MGTNFYTIDITKNEKIDHMDPEFHIGKRSAAGLYCWDCDITLCKDGKEFVHHVKKGIKNGKTVPLDSIDIYGMEICPTCGLQLKPKNYWSLPNVEWYKKCPKCGKRPKTEKLENSSAGRELGFNKNVPKRKRGVASCSSFSWAMELHKLEKK